MSKEKIVQLQDKDGNIVYPILKHNDYIDEDKKQTWLNQGSISVKKDTGEVSTEHRRQVNVSGSSTANGYNSQVNASNNSEASGNRSQVNASWDSVANNVESQVNASSESEASGKKSQVNASHGSTAIGEMTQVNASNESTASGEMSQINASDESEASGNRSQVNASNNSKASGNRSQVNASSECNISNGLNSQINSSWNCNNNVERGQINASLRCYLTKEKDEVITDSFISSSEDSSIHNSNKSSIISGRDSSINDSYGVSFISSWNSKSNNGVYSSLLSSNLSNNDGGYSSIIDSRSSEINRESDRGTRIYYSSILSSEFSKINGSKSSIIASDGGADRDGSCMIDKWNSVILASRNVVNPTEFTICGGLGGATKDEETGEGMGSAENRKWEINSSSGDIKASGSITGNSSFADFAEYMESSNGEQIPTGTIVSLDKGQKIRVAQSNDNPIGIISGTAGIILNAQGFEWKDRYLYDRYGQPIYVKKYMTYIKEELTEEEIENEIKPEIIGYKLYSGGEEIPEVGDTVDGKEIVKVEEIETQQLNPDWDEKAEYIPREDRDEWNVVGMKGQIYVNVDDTVGEGGYIKVGKDGIGTDGIIEVDYKGVKAHKLWQVMEITTPYNKDLGYGIARVII